MSETIIKVEGIGKKYIISHQGPEKYSALRDVIARKTKKWIKRKEEKFSAKEEFWALKDISFEINQGEAVGIIGRNGAGKSTLLKVLSRITEPSNGRIEINGRVASLLEVGTGFHPELTGRENIFLNGAILGMSRVEIKNKFDEIINFAGVEKFLDTPVKRYSSGMYVRLAFAVAAHLEPEILVVDEVLAVGDAEFQKKCIGKMDEVSKSGRTVLFVSHNMGVIAELCQKCILLDKGEVKLHDKTNKVLDQYNVLLSNSFSVYENKSQLNNSLHIKSISIQSRSGNNIFSFNEKIILKAELNITSEYFEGIHLGIALLDKWKRKIFTTHKLLEGSEKGTYFLSIPEQLFLNGYYSFDAALFVPNSSVFEYLKDICPFEILDFSSEMAQYASADTGIIQVKCEWN
ncbi:MAG: transporter ATP-binding protein [Chitinophagaceae bacterium]|nr:transporter ATP-binding protein [Chitinophagaceae bacterium]